MVTLIRLLDFERVRLSRAQRELMADVELQLIVPASNELMHTSLI